MFLRPDQANPTCQRSLRRQPRHPLYLQPWRGRNIVFFLEYKNPVFKMAQQLFTGRHRHHDDPAAWCAQNAVNERKARFFFWVVFISNSSPQALFAFILTFYFSLSLFLRRVRQLSRRVQDDIERGTDGVLQGLHPGLCSPRSPDHPHLHLLWATQNELRILPRTKMNKSSALTMTSGCANEI